MATTYAHWHSTYTTPYNSCNLHNWRSNHPYRLTQHRQFTPLLHTSYGDCISTPIHQPARRMVYIDRHCLCRHQHHSFTRCDTRVGGANSPLALLFVCAINATDGCVAYVVWPRANPTNAWRRGDTSTCLSIYTW